MALGPDETPAGVIEAALTHSWIDEPAITHLKPQPEPSDLDRAVADIQRRLDALQHRGPSRDAGLGL